MNPAMSIQFGWSPFNNQATIINSLLTSSQGNSFTLFPRSYNSLIIFALDHSTSINGPLFLFSSREQI
ncbi:MAG: hypothetical protein JW939_05400 [Candidatus Thermoplasmatota archaeon]|nr:hypothetical protein [Candidatus Thermoplasmatota archaeon]